MQPLPWSPSALDQFVSCPRQYHAQRILRTVTQEETEQQRWGIYVHKAFEDRQGAIAEWSTTRHGIIPEMKPLPSDLMAHEPHMQKLWDKPGTHFTELRAGFDKKAQPCGFKDLNVWCRLVIDYVKVDEENGRACVVDYKTGKQHSKFEQLYLYCLWVFAMFPGVNLVNAQFYWTQTKTTTKKVIGRDEIPALWSKFIPNLKQYAEAFKTDTWQPRQSGLCAGWCPVKECEFWRPKR